MGFSKKIKDQLLVETARRCCVCRDFKGTKVQIHHIKPKSLGGDNTYENAIVLCLDCHAEVGHYNDKHPIGTKFSPEELKKSKAALIDSVTTKNINRHTDTDSFLCQYFICKNYEDLTEISNEDYSNFPADDPLLVRNEILTYLDRIIKNHPSPSRNASAWGECYQNKGEYLKKYPDAVITKESEDKYSYFEAVRKLTRKELVKLSSGDGVLKLMLEEDISVEDISAIASYYLNACGENTLQEEYIFRELWCAFLAITNISDQPLALEAVEARQNPGAGFRPFLVPDQDSKINSIQLPKVSIEPGVTAIIPIAVLLPPTCSLEQEVWSSVTSREWREQIQTVTHGNVISGVAKGILAYGGAIFPSKLSYKNRGHIYFQNIHSFDFTNMYSIDRKWQIGSCPHLFFIQDKINYKRELLAHCESAVGEDSFSIPRGVSSFIIAEIEDETTEIQSIHINDHFYLSDLTLKKLEYIEIPVFEGDFVRVVGQYIPYRPSTKRIPQGIKRNEIVHEFMHGYLKWAGKDVYGVPTPSRLHS